MTQTTDKSTATEIFLQLGANRFKAMTGAKNFVCDNNSLAFMLPKAKDKINFVKITLNSLDLYNMEFKSLNYRTGEINTIKEFKGAYNDMLQGIFTDITGLNTSL